NQHARRVRYPEKDRRCLRCLCQSPKVLNRLPLPVKPYVSPMNSTESCIALNMLPTMGPVRLRKLLEVFGAPENVLAAKRDQLRSIEGIGPEVAQQIANWESIVD